MKKIFSTLIISMLLILSAFTLVSAEESSLEADAGGPYIGLTGEEIQFNASNSIGDITEYFWDFGNGNNVTGMIVNYSYHKHGIYNVNLTVVNESGYSNVSITTATIYAPPIADFTYNPMNPKPNENIIFDASISDDPDGNNSNLTYSWDLDDGNLQDNISFIHNYIEEGVYDVTLNVTDEEGYTDSIMKQIKVVDNFPPQVEIITPKKSTVYIFDSLTLERKNEDKPLIVGGLTIIANATDDHEIEKVEFYIDNEKIGTQNKSTDGISLYEYKWEAISTIGDFKNQYTIKVIAYDSHGETAESEIEVEHFQSLKALGITMLVVAVGVESYKIFQNWLSGRNETDEDIPEIPDITNQPPKAVINATSSANVNEEIILDASESTDDGIIERYIWDLGDGTEIEGKTITHEYTEKGKYTVTLIVIDDEGLEDLTSIDVHIEKSQETTKGTPGFGLASFMLIIALFAAIIIYKKKHKE